MDQAGSHEAHCAKEGPVPEGKEKKRRKAAKSRQRGKRRTNGNESMRENSPRRRSAKKARDTKRNMVRLTFWLANTCPFPLASFFSQCGRLAYKSIYSTSGGVAVHTCSSLFSVFLRSCLQSCSSAWLAAWCHSSFFAHPSPASARCLLSSARLSPHENRSQAVA